MHVRFVAAGRIREGDLRAALDDYYARIGRYARFEELELKDAPAKDAEALFARAIPNRARVIALEVDGEAPSSEGLARLIGRAENDAVQTLVFLIGGAYGLPPATSKAADLRLSLSNLTLPHRLARLLLAEQVYRGFTILRGEPYSH
ncbi:MAG: 23S rRNA (pseudouridine(1915)-N(3))-methyltransferase RlmH [Myxococcales bacterium]|nr:23S rRNA (pseudouridine(1915)-N(3))-methyltransferase RlmH [Myxococcales bacterium]